MIAIGIPVCRPLWKDWLTRVLPVVEDKKTNCSGNFTGLLTIGGSEMPKLGSKDDSGKDDSRPRSKSRHARKGSKGSRSNFMQLNSPINNHHDDFDIEMQSSKDVMERQVSPVLTPDSWSSWTHS